VAAFPGRRRARDHGAGTRVALAAIFVALIPFIIGRYFVFFWALTGRTIGRWFMGLKIIGRDNKTLSIGQALWRFIGYGVSTIVFWMGYPLVIADDER
jgi:uncharacterized RDD family membrane protein YckC